MVRRYAFNLRLPTRWREDRATVAVTFILSLPIFLTIVAIIVQTALLANAKLMTNHAAFMAGRSAITCLPDEQFPAIDRAARLALTPLSPQSTLGPDSEADNTYQSLLEYGALVTPTFPARYTYTMAATTVEYPHAQDTSYYMTRKGQTITVTVRYRFALTVPIAKMFIGQSDTVAGLTGRYFTIVSTCQVLTAHGRQAPTDTIGWPQQ